MRPIKSSFLIIGIVMASPTFLAATRLDTADLVNIQTINARIEVQMVYATKDNFTGQVIYELPLCYVHKNVALALNKAQQKLESLKSPEHPKGLRLKIWDGYRPLPAQELMWHACAHQYPDEKEREKYVSNPKQGGRHTRGTAVDVTLVDIATGKELAMPTGFDDFTPKAWRTYEDLPEAVKRNRKLLEDVMHAFNFKGVQCEWWHFDFIGWESYQPLNISLSLLAQH